MSSEAHAVSHAAHHPALQHHFDSLEQQQNASTFGMWVFMVQEVLFFGGMFMAYILYRSWYPEAWTAASNHLDPDLGLINTMVLIGSSLKAASTGKSEDVDTTIAELPPPGQAEVQAGLVTLAQDRTKRLGNARAKLMSMSEAEWAALVEEANADG